MSEKDYHDRLDKIIELDQFEFYEKSRINEKDPILKEEERINGELKKLLEGGQIEDDLYKKLRSTGAKPARIYGLAKIHKVDTPLRPIVSMPGTAYYNLGKWISNWLEKVPESRINTSSEDVSRDIKNITLNPDECLI